MTVRPAQPADIAALHALARECFGESAWMPHQLISTTMRHVLLAEARGAFAGFGVVAWMADESEIQAIGVAAPWRRQGVGAALLAACCREAAAHGATIVHLEVRASNTGAQAFYRCFGFEPVGRRRAYYHAPVEDAVLMRRQL